jgi:hypothetical protein
VYESLSTRLDAESEHGSTAAPSGSFFGRPSRRSRFSQLFLPMGGRTAHRCDLLRALDAQALESHFFDNFEGTTIGPALGQGESNASLMWPFSDMPGQVPIEVNY